MTVSEMQRLLNERGYPATVDGSFGPGTIAAIRAFQSENLDQNLHPLTVDGNAGPLTRLSLQNPKPSITPAPLGQDVTTLPEGGTSLGRAALANAIEELLVGFPPAIDKYLNDLTTTSFSWSTAFVSWCYSRTEPMPFSYSLDARALIAQLRSLGFTFPPQSGFVPSPGDIVLWWREKLNGWNGHAGIVHSVKDGMLYTIEGNRAGSVQAFAYVLSRLDDLLGFAQIPEGTAAPSVESDTQPALFQGFDTSIFPGLPAMNTWFHTSPFKFAGFYLTSPFHPRSSWTGMRTALTAIGWRLIAIYVGQQIKLSNGASNPNVTPERGIGDGKDAVIVADGEGFPAGTSVYLDVEVVDNVTPAYQSYIVSWVRTVLADSRGFRPAIYCHVRNAAVIRRFLDPISPEIRYWVVGGSPSDFDAADADPTDSTIAFAHLWQRPVSTNDTFGDVRINIDRNVSFLLDPSGPS